MIPFMFQKGNKAAGCEDSPPVATIHYSIVCDGLGGSGYTKHDVLEDSSTSPVKRTSAYLGSRIVSACVERFYQTHIGEFISSGLATNAVERLVGMLRSEIADAIAAGMKQYGIEPSRSRTAKIFPTTLASAFYCPRNGALRILAVWAGDSRIYVLSPTKGLQLLSVDDADNAADSMNSSSAMNNCISAGNPFHLNFALYEMTEPGIVFCCSDGCFDYFPSPLNLEWLLLNTILNCMPSCTEEDLGNTLATSIRDTMFQSIKDDTTMAGVCFQLGSSSLIKNLYQPRMDSFGQVAVQMNQALKNLKSVQAERDDAQKVCRLYEGKVTEAIQKAVCDALTAKYPVNLYGVLANMPTYAAYRDLETATNEAVTAKCNSEIDSLQEKANELRIECRGMLKADYLKWQRLQQDTPIGTGIFGTRSGKNVDRSNKIYMNPHKLEQPLLALIELFQRKELPSIVSFSRDIEENYEQFTQRQIEALRTIITMIGSNDELFTDLWGQAYFTIPMFSGEQDLLDRNPSFNAACDYALQEPYNSQFCSGLTARKITELKNTLAQRDAILDKYNKERQRSLAALPLEYYRQNKDAILNAILSQPEAVL